MATSSSPSLISVDPRLVLLVGGTIEQIHLGRPLGRATGLCLGARALAAVQAAQQPEGWAMQAYRYGLQPRLVWRTGGSEAWRFCSAPLLSASLQTFLAESLALWDHCGRREEQVGAWHVVCVDLPALVLASQALQVALSVALVRTGNTDVTKSFRNWYNAWSVGSTAVSTAFYALQCTTQPDAGSAAVCFGHCFLPSWTRPFACWEPLAVSCIFSPSALVSQGCAHVSGVWAGLLWGKLAYSAAGWPAPPILRNGILVRPGHVPDGRGGGTGADRHWNGGQRLGGDEGWWARSPMLWHAGITVTVLVLTHVAASKASGGRGVSTRTGSAATWQWPEWFASAGDSVSEAGSSAIGTVWDYIIIDTPPDVTGVRGLLADAAENARQTVDALWG